MNFILSLLLCLLSISLLNMYVLLVFFSFVNVLFFCDAYYSIEIKRNIGHGDLILQLLPCAQESAGKLDKCPFLGPPTAQPSRASV